MIWDGSQRVPRNGIIAQGGACKLTISGVEYQCTSWEISMPPDDMDDEPQKEKGKRNLT